MDQRKQGLNMLTRRNFIQKTALTAGALVAGNSLRSEVMAEEASQQLVILHTNDVHSRVEPFPADDKSV